MKISATLLAALLALSGLAAQLERDIEVPGVDSVVLACDNPGPWTFATSAARMDDGTSELDITLDAREAAAPPEFSVSINVPQCDTWHRWSHELESVVMKPHWKSKLETRLSSGYPFVGFVGSDDANRITVACSEAKRRVVFAEAGGHEEKATVSVKLAFFTEPEAPLSSYSVRLRFDRRGVFFGDAIADASRWVTDSARLAPAPVPPDAFAPVYSTWYSFHQNISDSEIEAECAEAANMGMKVVIVDDGWQTDDNNLGYAFCGDWEVSTNRFPDFAAHIERIHALGMKYMLWYSVPFVGEKSKNYERFKSMFVSNRSVGGGRILDPRFPEVRQFICGVYAKAMKDWRLDGMKLDFIDYINFSGTDPAVKENYAGRDIKSLAEATDRLMKDVRKAITAVKPDALIEFRQSYVGPAMRQYGNMFRARDCEGDVTANRSRIANMRLASGKTAVHADMLLWNGSDDPASSARFILSTIFGAVQYSMMLRTTPEDHKRMMRHWIEFSRRHEDALLHGAFRPHGYGENYPVIEAWNDEERIIGVYAPHRIVRVEQDGRDTYILNASGTDELVLDLDAPATAEVFDTYGKTSGRSELSAGISRVNAPKGGYIVRKIKN